MAKQYNLPFQVSAWQLRIPAPELIRFLACRPNPATLRLIRRGQMGGVKERKAFRGSRLVLQVPSRLSTLLIGVRRPRH